MSWNLTSSHTQPGDLAMLVGVGHKYFIFPLLKGGEYHSHRGLLKHDELVGLPWGSRVFSNTGAPFYILQPSLSDLLTDLPRNTQIMYPKDIGFILITLGVGAGQHILEAGTGSGSMCIALANAVGPGGKVVTYENRPEMQKMARKNLARLGLEERIDFKLGDIADGFIETDMDAIFLDVQNPWDYIEQVRAALKPGGPFCCLVPTLNQVSNLLIALRRNKFAFVEVCEILLRYYKPDPAHLRPTDRMVAHTGYLIYGRRVELIDLEQKDDETPEEADHNIDLKE